MDILLGLIFIIFWFWAFIDILKSDFEDNIINLIWLLVVFFLSVLGAILYYFIGQKQKV